MGRHYPYQPREHNGDMDKELLDVVNAQGQLANVHLMVASGQLTGATEAVTMYTEILCVEAEDYANKTRELEEALCSSVQ